MSEAKSDVTAPAPAPAPAPEDPVAAEADVVPAVGPEPEDEFDIDSWEPDEPLWMTTLPNDPDSNEAMMAINDLIYNDSSPNEVAENFKQQGNQFYKRGKAGFKYAGHWYTKAIETKDVTDAEILSACYSNRAACLLGLGNYGTCVKDCKKSIELVPTNLKAYFRAASACIKISKFNVGLQFCEDGLKIEPTQKSLLLKKQELEKLLEAQRRVEELRLMKQAEVQAKADRLQAGLDAKGIVMGPLYYNGLLDLLKDGAEVYLDAEEHLHFPMLFVYEEFHQTDFVQDVTLDQTFGTLLDMLFPNGESPPWDEKRDYTRSTVAAYSVLNHVRPIDKSKDSGKRARKVKMSEDSTLEKLLTHAECVVPGIPVIFITSDKYKRTFLKIAIDKLGHA